MKVFYCFLVFLFFSSSAIASLVDSEFLQFANSVNELVERDPPKLTCIFSSGLSAECIGFFRTIQENREDLNAVGTLCGTRHPKDCAKSSPKEFYEARIKSLKAIKSVVSSFCAPENCVSQIASVFSKCGSKYSKDFMEDTFKLICLKNSDNALCAEAQIEYLIEDEQFAAKDPCRSLTTTSCSHDCADELQNQANKVGCCFKSFLNFYEKNKNLFKNPQVGDFADAVISVEKVCKLYIEDACATDPFLSTKSSSHLGMYLAVASSLLILVAIIAFFVVGIIYNRGQGARGIDQVPLLNRCFSSPKTDVDFTPLSVNQDW